MKLDLKSYFDIPSTKKYAWAFYLAIAVVLKIFATLIGHSLLGSFVGALEILPGIALLAQLFANLKNLYLRPIHFNLKVILINLALLWLLATLMQYFPR